jgi:ribosome recycling factor
MPNGDYRETEKKMDDVLEATRKEFASIRTGRANPALLDRINVEAYGDILPINQVANVSVPEPRLLVIQPWDSRCFNPRPGSRCCFNSQSHISGNSGYHGFRSICCP